HGWPSLIVKPDLMLRNPLRAKAICSRQSTSLKIRLAIPPSALAGATECFSAAQAFYDRCSLGSRLMLQEEAFPLPDHHPLASLTTTQKMGAHSYHAHQGAGRLRWTTRGLNFAGGSSSVSSS